jgi:hypothetical protein
MHFFDILNPSSHTAAMGFTQLLTETKITGFFSNFLLSNFIRATLQIFNCISVLRLKIRSLAPNQ